MALKYEKLDAALFSWLRKHRRGITTASAIHALKVTCPTAKRHVSRRFSQLEDRGTLVCSLDGTTRVCRVEGAMPDTLAKQRAHIAAIAPANQNIHAADADEFVAAGGEIQRLPSAWDNPEKNRCRGSLPMGQANNGSSYSFIDIND
jgi:hypothetical protein